MELLVAAASWLVLTLILAVVSMFVVVAGQHARFVQYHRYKRQTLPPMSGGELLRLWAGEVYAWCVLAWWKLTAWMRDGRWDPPHRSGRLVLCVHGFTQDGTNWVGLRRRLLQRGRPSRALYLGRPLQPLTGYVPRLEAVLEEELGREAEIDVVCHSMGGIILRMVLKEHPEWRDRVRNVVNLGSPHAGTASPRGIAFAADMRGLSRRSVVLRELPPTSELAPNAHVTNLYARRDFIVYPASSSEDPGARNLELTGVGHGGLLVFDRVLGQVVDALTEPAATREQSA